MSATCLVCDRPMNKVSCVPITWVVNGIECLRIRYFPMYGNTAFCHDCNTPNGGLHHPGCDMERCPACGEQAIGCGCKWEGDPEKEDEETLF